MDSEEKEQSKSKYHPIINVIITEWGYLGKRRKKIYFLYRVIYNRRTHISSYPLCNRINL